MKNLENVDMPAPPVEPLSARRQQVLRDQAIDEEQPGPILRDFEALVSFIDQHRPQTTSKHHLLPGDCLEPLCASLSHPIRIEGRRPHQRSNPYLHGLYLLLRATGLASIQGDRKVRITIAPRVRDSWRQLNATERYFTLLEAWLRQVRPGMIAESDQPLCWLVSEPRWYWKFIPQGGLASGDHVMALLQNSAVAYWFALLELFGLVDADHSNPTLDRWPPRCLRRNRFGETVFTVLADEKPAVWTWLEPQLNAQFTFGQWQEMFRPWFPAWQRNLEVPAEPFRDGVFVFKVALGNVWRRIALPAKMDLEDLVGAILRAFRFDASHLYQFTCKNRFGTKLTISTPEAGEEPWTDQVQLGDLPLAPGQTMEFLYDFGDMWRFSVKLEAIEPPSPRLTKAMIRERHGEPPPQYGRGDG